MANMRKPIEPPLAPIEEVARRWRLEAPERERQQAAERRAQEINRTGGTQHGDVMIRTAYHCAKESPVSEEETNYWKRWDEWAQAHIRNALEVEREFQRDTIAQCLAEMRADLRKEMRTAFANEAKALGARIDDLRDMVSSLLKGENSVASDLHKEAMARVAECSELRDSLSKLSRDVVPIVDSFHGR